MKSLVTFIPRTLAARDFNACRLRRVFRLPVRLALLWLSAGTLLAQNSVPPNILFIAVDDLRPVSSVLDARKDSSLATILPDPVIRRQVSAMLTPNIDRLAAVGTTFARAYSSSPRCNPSRAAILTGQPAHRTNFYDFTTHFRDVPALARAVTLPQALKNAGYHTVGLGKIFASPFETDEGKGLTDWADTKSSWDQWGNVEVGLPITVDKLTWGTNFNPNLINFDYLNAAAVADLLTAGSAVINEVKTSSGSGPAELTLDNAKPFFLAVGLNVPHSPWVVPADVLAKIPPRLFGRAGVNQFEEVLEDFADLPQGARKYLRITNPEKRLGKYQRILGISPTEIRRGELTRRSIATREDMIRHYLASVHLADRNLGKILDGLFAGPYASNTVVVFFSDHGVHLGEKLHIGKTTLWEQSLRSQMIVADLRRPISQVITEPVSLVDIYPTVLEYANVALPAAVDTQSLVRTITSGSNNPERVIFSSIDKGYVTVAQRNYRYLHHGSQREAELYDIARDPGQVSNLLAVERNGRKDATFRKTMRLKKRFERLVRQIAPRGSVNVPVPPLGGG